MTHTMRVVTFTLLGLGLVSTSRGTELENKTSRSFSVGKGGTLELTTSSGNIRISGWGKEEVSVSASGIEDQDAKNLSMSQTGRTVSVRFDGESGSWSDIRFDISVPDKFNIDIKTSGGDLDVEGPLSGTLSGSTSGGSIRLGSLGGTISMSTSGGDVKTGDIEGDLSLTSSGGDILVGMVSGNANLKTAGGEIHVKDVGKKIYASTAGGNVAIGNVGGQATISTAGGDVTVGKVSGSSSLTTSGGDIVLQSASGVVSAKTAGGDLHLDGITGSVEGNTAGGDIVVRLVPGTNGKSTLSTSAGDILLLVPENAKATIEARIHINGRWKRPNDEFTIHSDFKTDTYEKDDRSHEIRATVKLNGGGETISLETMMGDIEILKDTGEKLRSPRHHRAR